MPSHTSVGSLLDAGAVLAIVDATEVRCREDERLGGMTMAIG